MLPTNLKFNCGTLPQISGREVKACKPDANGFYNVTIGALNTVTRAGVIYDDESVVAAMNDPKSVFNIELRNGSLYGEIQHPTITRENMDRLTVIDSEKVSHFFNRIWVDENPTEVEGRNIYLIKAQIRPAGPYGDVLVRDLEDPYTNNAFSIRSLCTKLPDRGDGIERRKVLCITTFDHVLCCGVAGAEKRYFAGNESLEIPVTVKELYQLAENNAGNEAFTLPKSEIDRIVKMNDANNLSICNVPIYSVGKKSYMSEDGRIHPKASLFFKE